MLKDSPPETLFHTEQFISTPCLCLVLENVAFPSAIFNRLLVGSMEYWPIFMSNKKYHIYCGCGQFSVDVHHRLTLTFRSNIISLRLTRFGESNREPSVSLCYNVYSKVKQILERISKHLSLVLKFEECIQCPHDTSYSVSCIHSVEKLKKDKEIPCHEHGSTKMIQSDEMLKYWFDLTDKVSKASLVYKIHKWV